MILGLAVCAAVVCVDRFWPDKGWPRSQTLADGSVFRVESVSFGTNHYYPGTGPKPWQLAIGQRLPYWLATRMGWRFDTKGIWFSLTNLYGGTSLEIVTAHEGSGRSAADHNQMRVVVLDEKGNSLCWYGAGGSGNFGRDLAGLHYHQSQSWWVPAFPRREKNLVVRFLREQGDGKADLPAMQIRIANPSPGLYPAWTPEPWPATKDTGDLAATLTDFTTGLSESQMTRAAVENEPVVTRLGLDLQVKDQTNCPWQVKFVEISDATGNRWESVPMGLKSQARAEGVTQTMTMSGNLWASEPAWKLRIELSPTAKAPPEASATLADIVLPPEGTNAPLSLATNLGGISLRLQRIETRKPPARAKRPGRPVRIFYNFEGMPDDCHLSLTRVSDDQGRKVPINGSGELSRWGDSFELAAPTNAASLNCTFAVRKSRFVEFTAKPRMP